MAQAGTPSGRATVSSPQELGSFQRLGPPPARNAAPSPHELLERAVAAAREGAALAREYRATGVGDIDSKSTRTDLVTTADRARSGPKPPVYLKGLGFGDQARKQWWDKSNYTQVDGAFAAKQAFAEAGENIWSIDVAELYDCFTMEIIFYLEDYGYCKKGEAGEFLRSGATRPGGSFPINTHGGLLSGMYLFDFPNVVEATRQLRGEAGDRQVPNAHLALTNGHGGEMVEPFMCSSHATMILGNELS